ncbi:MAG: hypothetical protein M1829_004356 [Trizodia sp. TS-e1964]|nr:MAG: hypothetical protein M1829_004356 [Trizodia sp. TS-e1964]
MTLELCAAFCVGTVYYGLENGGECYCGNTIDPGALAVPTENNCITPCSGNIAEICGGAHGGRGYISVYSLETSTPPVSSTTSVSASTSTAISTQTITATLSSVSTSTSSVASSTPTNIPAGFQGCYEELQRGRALAIKNFASDTMSLELCAAFCAGTVYYGIENGRECYCGNTLDPGALAVPVENNCVIPCSGNVAEVCGGAHGGRGYISLYSLGGTPSVVSSLTTVSSTTASSTVTATSTPTVILGSPQGCYEELQRGRALTVKNFASDSMTIELCAAFCAGTIYYGLENGRECYCGNTIDPGALAVPVENNCVTPCPGNTAEICGGAHGGRGYISVFTEGVVSSSSLSTTLATQTGTSILSSTSVTGQPTQTTSIASSTATPSIISNIGPYVFQNCYSELSSGHSLDGPSFVSDTLTVESCAVFCVLYNLFGVENGRECVCGNAINQTAALVPSADCNSPCAGNTAQICGGNGNVALRRRATSPALGFISIYSRVLGPPPVTSVAPSSTSTITSANATVSALTTSTVFATSVATITACAATVTDCPAHSTYLTTSTIALYTTVCPVTIASTTAALVSTSNQPTASVCVRRSRVRRVY